MPHLCSLLVTAPCPPAPTLSPRGWHAGFSRRLPQARRGWGVGQRSPLWPPAAEQEHGAGSPAPPTGTRPFLSGLRPVPAAFPVRGHSGLRGWCTKRQLGPRASLPLQFSFGVCRIPVYESPKGLRLSPDASVTYLQSWGWGPCRAPSKGVAVILRGLQPSVVAQGPQLLQKLGLSSPLSVSIAAADI